MDYTITCEIQEKQEDGMDIDVFSIFIRTDKPINISFLEFSFNSSISFITFEIICDAL